MDLGGRPEKQGLGFHEAAVSGSDRVRPRDGKRMECGGTPGIETETGDVVDEKDIEDVGDEVSKDSEVEELIAEDFGAVSKPSVMPSPYTPSKKEVEEHEVAHWPYRSWCPDCVRGRGRPTPHRGKHDYMKEIGEPMVVGDYCYLSGKDRQDGQGAPILVLREVRSGATTAMLVPNKGDSTQWVVNRVADWMDDLGSRKIVVKTDQESSVTALMKAVRAAREVGSVTVIEHSPVGESQSNGAAERAVGEVKGMIRTIKAALDRKFGGQVGDTHAILPWAIEHAAVLLSRHKIHKDGRTPYEAIRGKKASTPLCCFAEKVMFLPAKTAKERKWAYGIFVGLVRKSNEYVVTNTEGAAVKTRNMKRLPENQRWDADMVTRIQGTPWAPVDGVRERPVPVEIQCKPPPGVEVPEAPVPGHTQIRRMKIPKEMYLRHGDPRCKGCAKLRQGRYGEHSSECVRKVEEALKSEPVWANKFAESYERETRHMVRRLEAADEAEAAKRAKTTPVATQSSASSAPLGAPRPPGAPAQAVAASSSAAPESDVDMNSDRTGEQEERCAKRIKTSHGDVMVLDTSDMQLQHGQVADDLKAAIEGGVHLLIGRSTVSTAADASILKALYLQQMKQGGTFIHWEQQESPKEVQTLQHAMAMELDDLGIRMVTNSEAPRKVAMASRTRGCRTIQEIQNDIIEKISSFHNCRDAAGTRANCNMHKMKRDIAEVNQIIHDAGERHCWDDVKGGWLPLAEVEKARRLEMQYIHDMKLYKKVSKAEAVKKNKVIIPVKWVDTNKGTDQAPVYRSRLVAKEIKRYKDKDVDDELFAAMPPLEAIRMVISHAASIKEGSSHHTRSLMTADVSRAYFNAPARRPIYVEIPAEDHEPGDEHRCGELLASMYGTRDAARNWYEELRRTFLEIGATVGIASPSVFRVPGEIDDVLVAIHGDDIVAAGEQKDLERLLARLRERFELKHKFLGRGCGKHQTIELLNGKVTLENTCITIEADARHVNLIIQEAGVKEGNGRQTPIDQQIIDEINRGEPMTLSEARRYRGLAARLNYLALDRPDLKIAAMHASRVMSAPYTGAWKAIKAVGRYLRDRPRLVWKYAFQDDSEQLYTCTDSDWGGDRRERKSTSGGAIWKGCHLIKAWAKGQGAIALSSMEAELYAAVFGATEMKGIQGLAKDWGIDLSCALAVDSSAALGFMRREGLGKARHIELHWLWIQQESRSGRIQLRKIGGAQNPADMFTKPLAKTSFEDCVRGLRCEFR